MKDDPTKKNCIFCCGLRHVEEEEEHSNQASFVMFCGSSSGAYLPLMVVYKAQHYKGWTDRWAKWWNI